MWHNWVVNHKIQMHWFLKAESLGENPTQKKPGYQFKGYDSLGLRRVKRVSGKRKDHRWERNVKALHLRSPYAMKFEDRPMKRLNDSSDVPEASLGIFPKTNTSSKKNTRLHSTFPRRNGYSRQRQQKSRRKESF